MLNFPRQPGLRYALLLADPTATVIAAFDVNEVANKVYTHNFNHPPVNVNISGLTAAQLDESYEADIWLLSPPCQPYTRRGLKLESADERAQSFLVLLEHIIPQLRHPPTYILVENVVGFETSDTRDIMKQCLEAAGYSLQEFCVSPTQLGVPYSRPRYFALAKKRQNSTSESTAERKFALPAPVDGLPFQHPPSTLLKAVSTSISNKDEYHQNSQSDSIIHYAPPIKPIKEYLFPSKDGDFSNNTMFKLSDKILLQHGWCLDIVTPEYNVCNCFTKTYGTYIKVIVWLVGKTQN